MQLNTLVLLLTILRAATAFEYGSYQLNGSCPKVSYITNLDLPPLLGWWYKPFSNFKSPLCFNNEGHTAYAYPTNTTEISVACCCRSAVDTELVTCSPQVGTGILNALSNPGMFSYEFDDNIYTVFVLDIDYENFGVIYGCKPGLFNTRDELIFIFTRDYQLSSTLEPRVRGVFQRNNIDWSNALAIKQGPSVPYIPGPKNCK